MKKQPAHLERFCALHEDNLDLWSDAYVESQRQNSYVRWCFDTGDPEDLARFERLDQEIKKRKEHKCMIEVWAKAVKEDPVWRDHLKMLRSEESRTKKASYRYRNRRK